MKLKKLFSLILLGLFFFAGCEGTQQGFQEDMEETGEETQDMMEDTGDQL